MKSPAKAPVRPPVTDPHQLLVLSAARWRGLAFSALPDAPVLPVTVTRRARVARVLGRVGATLRPRRRHALSRRPAVAASPAPCG